MLPDAVRNSVTSKDHTTIAINVSIVTSKLRQLIDHPITDRLRPLTRHRTHSPGVAARGQPWSEYPWSREASSALDAGWMLNM